MEPDPERPTRERGIARARRAARCVAGACAAALALVGADAAQAKPVVVASAGEVRLSAEDMSAQLCIRFNDDEVPCGGPGRHPSVAFSGRLDGTIAYFGAAVPAQTATVAVVRGTQTLATAPTQDGAAYTGRLRGRVRFAIVTMPPSVQRDGLRAHALDADGVLLEVLAPIATTLTGEERPLSSGRSRGLRWTTRVQTTSTLAPSVLDVARESRGSCVLLHWSGPGFLEGDADSCADDVDLPDTLRPKRELLCARGTGARSSWLLAGRAGPTTTRVRIRLGSGRSIDTETVLDEETRTRYYATAVAGTEAVQSVEITVGGRTQTIELAEPPAVVACATDDAILYGEGLPPLGDFSPAVAPTTAPVSSTTSPPFRVADGPRDTLCLAFGDAPFTAVGCGPVSPSPAEPLLAVDTPTAPRKVVVALPSSVASVRQTAPGRAPKDIATFTLDGYAGTYAGKVRFAVLDHNPADGASLSYRDAQGAELDRSTIVPESASTLKAAGPARRIAGRAERPSLWRTPGRIGSRRAACLAITLGPRPDAADRCTSGAPSLLVDARCATSGLIVAVAVRAGSRATALLADGSRRTIPVRSGAGLITLPRRAGLRAIRIQPPRGRATAQRFSAPSRAQQCGWAAHT